MLSLFIDTELQSRNLYVVEIYMLTFIHLDEGNAVGGCVRYISNQSIALMCICCAAHKNEASCSCVYLCSFIYGSLVITLLIVPISFGTLGSMFYHLFYVSVLELAGKRC